MHDAAGTVTRYRRIVVEVEETHVVALGAVHDEVGCVKESDYVNRTSDYGFGCLSEHDDFESVMGSAMGYVSRL